MMRTGKISLKIACLLLVIIMSGISASVPLRSAEEEWERLTAASFELYRSGQYDDAIRISREALESAKETFGPQHPVVAQSMNNLGAMLTEHGDAAEAELLLTGSLDILEKSLKKDDPGIASTLNNLAGLYSSQARYEEAEPLYLRALSIRESEPGEDHIDLLTTLENLAGMYVRMDRFRDAEKLYSRALRHKEEYLGKGHPDTEVITEALIALFIREGNYYQERDDFDGAVTAYTTALEILEILSKEDLEGTASLLETIAVLYAGDGEYDDAVFYYGKLIHVHMQLHGERSLEYAGSSRDLARIYIRMEQYEKAAPLYDSVVDIHSDSLAADDPDLIRSLVEQMSAMTSLARSYVESGNTVDAVPLFAEVIELREAAGKGDEPAQAVLMNNLAGLLVGLERYEEAEKLYSEALEVLKRSTDGGQSHRTLILENMRQLYRLTGDLEQAAVVDSLLGGNSEGP